MATAYFAPLGKYAAFKYTGGAILPAAGYLLYTYAAGTTTPLATYQDRNQAVTNTNPVVLDANGEADVWLSSAAYKLVLKTAAGATVRTTDNIHGPEEAGVAGVITTNLANTTDVALGDALIGVKQPFTGAVATTQHEFNGRTINVFDFMSAAQKADISSFTGSISCETAINSASAAAVALNAGLVEFPAGKYRIEGTITLGTGENPIKWRGDGNYETTKGTVIAWYGGNATSAVKVPGYGSIEDMFIVNSNSATTVIGVDLVGVSAGDNRANAHLKNTTAKSFSVGFALDYAWNIDLQFCWALYNTIGYDLRTEANAITFTGCVANNNATGITDANGSGARGVLWSGGAIQSNTVAGIVLDPAKVSNSWVFDGVYFEGNYRTAVLAEHVEMNMPFINGDGGGGARPPIQIAASRGVRIVDAYPSASITQLFECTGADAAYVGNSIYVTSSFGRVGVQQAVYANANILGLGWLDSACYQTIETEWINASAAFLKPISFPSQAFNLRERKLIRCTMVVMTQIVVIAPDFTVGTGRLAGYVDIATRAFTSNVAAGAYDIPLVGGAPGAWASNTYNYWASGTAETSGMYKLIFTFI